MYCEHGASGTVAASRDNDELKEANHIRREGSKRTRVACEEMELWLVGGQGNSYLLKSSECIFRMEFSSSLFTASRSGSNAEFMRATIPCEPMQSKSLKGCHVTPKDCSRDAQRLFTWRLKTVHVSLKTVHVTLKDCSRDAYTVLRNRF